MHMCTNALQTVQYSNINDHEIAEQIEFRHKKNDILLYTIQWMDLDYVMLN